MRSIWALVSGDSSIRKAKENRPDLIVLDVMMPGEGGAETYRELKQDVELQHVPVILMYGRFLHSLTRAAGVESGASAVPWLSV